VGGGRDIYSRTLDYAKNPADLVEAFQRRARNLGSFAVQKYLLGRRYVERPINGFRLVLDSDDPGISRQLLYFGRREAEQKHLVEQLLKPGMTALDIGANIGYFTVMMARIVGSTGRVYAAEPHPGNVELLRTNVERNGVTDRTEVHELAISRTSGRQPLLLSEHSNWHSLFRPALNACLPWHDKYRRRVIGAIEVETQTLADYLRGKRPIDFLHMDIEGYEVEILRSIADLAGEGSGRLHVLFETHPEFYDPHYNDIRPVLAELCGRHGYRVGYLVSDYEFGWREHPDVEPARGVFARQGYEPAKSAPHFRNRAIYTGLNTADAIELIASREQVHAALLVPA
jgi:FkbM family methyltransferase